MFFDYSHRLSNLVWLNFKLNPTFGAGETRTICYDQFGNAYDCGTGFDGNGYAIDLLAGVKLKWMTRIHLMPYASANAGVVPVFARPAGDNGAAVVFNTGGGVKYFITPRIGSDATFFVFGALLLLVALWGMARRALRPLVFVAGIVSQNCFGLTGGINVMLL